MSGVFPKLKNPPRRLGTPRKRNRGPDLRGLNPITLLPVMIICICVPLLTVLSSPFRSPFSFGRPTLSQGFSEEDLKPEFALRVDWKDTGEEAVPTSGPSQDQISLASDAFEFESSSESTLFKVGSLKSHVDFWSNSVQASDFIISTIVDGYRIPFFNLPASYAIPNRSFAFKFKDFVNEAISELIERGCVMEVDIPPVFINPLHVVQQSSGKCRLILDLSYLNKFVWKQSVRYEDVRTVFDLFHSGYFFFTFDLKSGYHHVEIFPDHRQYLGFSWRFDFGVKYFVFSVLPFGLSSAPYIFTKLVRALVGYWRGLGRRVVMFLDDGIGGAPDFVACLEVSRLCRVDLEKAGFFVNDQKSVWIPSQVGVWLGYCLDFSRCLISMPSAKIMKLKESISRILSQRFVTAKELASVAGQLISMFLAIGNTVRLMSRSMYSQISEQVSWFCPFTLHDSVKSELVFWLSNLDQHNGRPIWFKSSTVRIAYSDASDTGYGGYIVELGPQVAAQGVWSSDMANQSSTLREILAVRKVLESFAPKLAGLCVKWFTDNQNVARIIDIGSPKLHLQEEARRIFHICVSHGISIEPEWVPRASNEQADYLSRIVDPDDWSVSLPIFKLLNSRWGPHTVDRFADEHNCLLPRFDSRFWNPLCEAMDTFTRSWEFENNWLCPPPHLVARALRHMRSCCAKGTLITPLWRSAPFWPLLTSDGLHFASFVVDWMDLPPLKSTFCPGRHSHGVFGREDLHFRVLAVRINFRSARFFNAGFCTSDLGSCAKCGSVRVW